MLKHIHRLHCAAAALRYAKRRICIKRDLQKRPAKETYKRPETRCQNTSIACIAQQQRFGMQKDESTFKETYERDLQTIDCLYCAAATQWYAKRTE